MLESSAGLGVPFCRRHLSQSMQILRAFVEDYRELAARIAASQRLGGGRHPRAFQAAIAARCADDASSSYWEIESASI